MKTKSRKAKILTLKQAKHIGVLFNATRQTNFEIIRTFVKELQEQGKQVDVLGYVDSKQLIDHYLYRKGFEFFTRKQLTYFFVPDSNSVERFIDIKFDILINLGLELEFPIKYILALSNAKFKVGKQFNDISHLDMLIDTEQEVKRFWSIQNEIQKDKKENTDQYEINEKTNNEIQLNFLINQVVHYLNILKN